MCVRSLLDTNILVYADSPDETPKQRRAIALISELRSQGLAVLSTQVLQEFVNVALRKLHRLSFYDARIVQAASVSGCPRLLSEDIQDGAVIAGVKVENPFAS